MLYHLFKYLSETFDIPGAGLFNYLTFRAIFAGLISLIVSFCAGGAIIRLLRKKQIGETIRDLGLEGQISKKGTPTMGGIIIILAILSSALLVCDLSNIYTRLLLLTTVWCGGIGLADDCIKVFKHDKGGLSEKSKLTLQFILGLAVALIICFSEAIHTDELITTIPFVKAHEFNYAWLSPFKGQLGVYCTWFIYMAIIIFIILACSNGANLCDGMDGLAAGTSAIVGLVLGIMAWLGSSVVQSTYLNIMSVPGSGEVAVFMAAFVGALIGFLWYNAYPAQVFMGDTGSLAIGGIIGVTAVLIRKELILPILCGIFLMESLSVLLQRAYFKCTKRKYGQGRRIWKMTPLHHHYQKEGVEALVKAPAHAIPEAKIVTRFWIIGILLGIITLAIMKIR